MGGNSDAGPRPERARRRSAWPVVAVVEHEVGAPLGRMAEWLAATGLELRMFRPYQGDALPTPGSFDALIVLGGQPGAADDDDAPWLPGLRTLMAEVLDEGTPQLGICLGAQLLALVGGGDVRRSKKGPEIGVVHVEMNSAAVRDDLASQLSNPYVSFSYHYDEIVELPPGAVLLGGNARFPHQLFRVGRTAWGIQSHPEVRPEDFTRWLTNDADGLPARDRAQVRREVAALEEELLEHGRAVARAFSSIVSRETPRVEG